MHDRVFPPRAPTEILKNRRHVGALQQQRQIIDNPRDAAVDAGAGNLAEYVAQERRRVGESGRLARERPGRRIVQAARREQPIGRRLRVQIGEIRRAQVGDQRRAVARQHFMKRARFPLSRKNAPDAVAQQARLPRHPLRQLARARNRRRIGREKRLEKRRNARRAAAIRRERAGGVDAPEARRLPQRAVRVAAELEIVRQNQVRQPPPVAPQLLPRLDAVERRAHILALDMPQRNAVADDDEIGRAALRMRGFVERPRALARQPLDKPLKRRPVTMLGRLPRRANPRRLATVSAEQAPRRPIIGHVPAYPSRLSPASIIVPDDGVRRPYA